jgi:hypothetical protein
VPEARHHVQVSAVSTAFVSFFLRKGAFTRCDRLTRFSCCATSRDTETHI